MASGSKGTTVQSSWMAGGSCGSHGLENGMSYVSGGGGQMEALSVNGSHGRKGVVCSPNSSSSSSAFTAGGGSSRSMADGGTRNPLLFPQHPSHHHHHLVKQCAACGQNIVDRYLLHTMDRFWHIGCLKCTCCQVALGDVGTTCFNRAGMTLCKADYIRLFGSTGTCCGCQQLIPANEFVMKTQGSVYHVTCFACATCHNRLVPGDRYGIVNGSLICENDYFKIMKTTSSDRTNQNEVV